VPEGLAEPILWRVPEFARAGIVHLGRRQRRYRAFGAGTADVCDAIEA
jgi:hypothetical protein